MNFLRHFKKTKVSPEESEHFEVLDKSQKIEEENTVGDKI